VLLLALPLAGCGGGGGGGGGPSGVFLDSAVSGVDWTTSAGVLGTTGADGRFGYGAGQTVLFSIGDVVLGVAAGAAIVTPVDLVPGAVDETDEAVVNLARFLQTLDLDLDPDNGIAIDPLVRQAAEGVTIDFTQGVAAFEAGEQAKVDLLTAGLPGGSRALVAAQEAADHLGDTLRRIVAGRYDGSYQGDSSGSFSVFVDRRGVLYGWALDVFDGLIALTGDAETDGGFVAGNASTGATFSGTIEPDGTLAGTWQLASEGGTFAGTRTVALALDLDSDLIELLAGTYAGTSNDGSGPEPFSVQLDSDGNLLQAPPDDHLSGTIVATSGTSASLVALDDEGTRLLGTVTLAGDISGTFANAMTGESGTFAGTRQ
jgi:hypothetical protein